MLRTITDSFKYDHHVYDIQENTNIINRVSYYNGKFYSYLINHNFPVEIVVIPNILRRKNTGTIKKVCEMCLLGFNGTSASDICYNCEHMWLNERKIKTLNIGYMLAGSSYEVINSYIRYIDNIRITIHTILLKNNKICNTACESFVMISNKYSEDYIPFMAAQLAPQMILIREFDTIYDIRRLISLLVIELSLA